MHWTQPLCDDDWYRLMPGCSPDRRPVSEANAPACCVCGRLTLSGIFTRLNPRRVPYPVMGTDTDTETHTLVIGEHTITATRDTELGSLVLTVGTVDSTQFGTRRPSVQVHLGGVTVARLPQEPRDFDPFVEDRLDYLRG